eukprot:3210594-Pleurochrysis_carterae.AAC.1
MERSMRLFSAEEWPIRAARCNGRETWFGAKCICMTNTCVTSLRRLRLVREPLSERSGMCAMLRGEQPLASSPHYYGCGTAYSLSVTRAAGTPRAGLAPRSVQQPSSPDCPCAPAPTTEKCRPGGRWAGIETASAAAGVAIVRVLRTSGDAPLPRALYSRWYVASLSYKPAVKWCGARGNTWVFPQQPPVGILLCKILRVA